MIRITLLAVLFLLLVVSGVLTVTGESQAGTRQPAPWLDVPAAWSRKVENNVVTVSPNDLQPGATLLLLVEPSTKSTRSIVDDYEQALRDLAPWTPVGAPIEQRFDSGWVFRMGVGIVMLEGKTYTAQTAVARHRTQRVRFWVLADSDNTFNRYKNTVAIAITSAQDITEPPVAKSVQSNTTVRTLGFKMHKPSPGFGNGISGVYAGLERGLSAGAGVGTGAQQVFNQSTGRFETSNSGTAPQMQTQISDYMEVDVFYPDGTYRRRLPLRGLGSDPNWERQQQKPLWGTWQRQGSKLVVQRGSYTTTYKVKDDNTLISDRDRPWAKIKPHNGARIDGVFARGDYREIRAPRLVLHADGTYEERGDFLRMIGSVWNLVVPDGAMMVSRWSEDEARHQMGGGRGVYTLENFTLTLHDRAGRIWQINAYIPPGENLPAPRRLVANGRMLVRD